MNGSSTIVCGWVGSNASVHRTSVRSAPFSIVSNHAPPSSAYFPKSSATPYWIGGTAATAAGTTGGFGCGCGFGFFAAAEPATASTTAHTTAMTPVLMIAPRLVRSR